MNEFQPVVSGPGILKDTYDTDETPQLKALRQRRLRMQDKITTPDKDDLEGNEKE